MDSELKELKPDWVDKQCDKVFAALDGFSLDDKLSVIEQVQDYLRMEEASGVEDD